LTDHIISDLSFFRMFPGALFCFKLARSVSRSVGETSRSNNVGYVKTFSTHFGMHS